MLKSKLCEVKTWEHYLFIQFSPNFHHLLTIVPSLKHKDYKTEEHTVLRHKHRSFQRQAENYFCQGSEVLHGP